MTSISPFRAALIAYGHGEWAIQNGDLVRVAKTEPLQLANQPRRS